MENSFKSFLDQSKSVLILLPANPELDKVAAGLSLYLVLQNNKDTSIICPSPMTVEFNRLVGVNRISQDFGSKNLVIRFIDYRASDVERVSYDIEEGLFKLTVMPKADISAPRKEQINFSYSGVSCDLVILLGGLNESDFPALSSKDLTGMKILHVGNKEINLTSNISVMSFVKKTSSVSEVISLLMGDSGLMPDQDVATNLIAGIEQGSRNLTSEEVNADTFEILSELMRAGGKRHFYPQVQKEYPAGSIPGSFGSDQGQGQLTVSQTVQNNQETGFEEKPQQEDYKKVPEEWLEKPRVYKGGYQAKPSGDVSLS